MKVVALILFMLLGVATVDAQRTTRHRLKVETSEPVDTLSQLFEELDTLRLPGDLVSVSGYEKPLMSRRESFHLTNASEYDIVELTAVISYLDFQDKELHKREVNIIADVPAGSTRLLTFPSWDTQNMFYFDGGPVPRRQAYPYHIALTISEILVRAVN